MLHSKQMQAQSAAHRNGSSNVFKTDSLTVRLASDPPGVVDASGAYPGPGIVIHLGSSVEIACRRGGQSHRGLAVHGDIDIVPPGVPSRWEVKQKDTALIIGVHSEVLRCVAEERASTSGASRL